MFDLLYTASERVAKRAGFCVDSSFAGHDRFVGVVAQIAAVGVGVGVGVGFPHFLLDGTLAAFMRCELNHTESYCLLFSQLARSLCTAGET